MSSLMNILNWFNRNKKDYSTNWEETENGKRFYQECLSNAEKRRLEKEIWERTTPYEKKYQVKLFKIFVTFFSITYTVLLYIGFKMGNELWILLGEFLLSGFSLLLFFIKPKFIKYPNCFLMPVIAFALIIFLYLYMGFYLFGFNPNERKNLNDETCIELVKENENNNDPTQEYFNNDETNYITE